MRFRCPFCYFTIEIDESMRGYPVSCPGCSHHLTVPCSRLQEDCIIGDFLIKSKLGEGSIGSVYLATQLSLERQVALKILRPECSNRAGIRNFLKEARAAAALNHINLVQSFAVGEDDGVCYMAMTYISGTSVMNRIRKEKMLPVDESLHIIQQTAEALHYAWKEQGLVHRDLKPDNIMVTAEGIVKVTDLGLAINASEWQDDSIVSGSPQYMAPEIFNGAKPDQRTDVYALGITLYQMLTGKLPYDAETVRTLAYQHQEETPLPPEKLNPEITPQVGNLLKEMIAKDPDKRIKNMEQLLQDIWLIRQKTAPDRQLIPDIHTISMRRLDYDIQRDSVHMKDTVSKLEYQTRSQKKILRVLFFLIPLVILLAVSITLLWYGNTPTQVSAENQLSRKIQYLKRLVNDETIPLQDVRDEGENIIFQFGKPKNQRQELMLEQVRSLIDQADLRRIKIENENLQYLNRQLQSENHKLRLKLKSHTASGREKITK